jgi:cysteinyl-tRNA synthetase
MKVKMYTCGPSTYQPAHIGNYRTFLFEDILQRYLEYLGYKVERLITLTDIEDKAIVQARKEGVSIEELSSRNEKLFFETCEKLRIKRPSLTIRASTIAAKAAELTGILLAKGFAYKYVKEGLENVYFDPLKFSGFGKLAHLDMNKWPKKKRRFHLDTYPGAPWNRGDFVLWHGCRNEETVCWDTNLGKGRPAWNMQDAAMVIEHLGYSVDVACGGIDNLVRHHDYTLAVAEAVSGKPFARYWLHGGHLYVKGRKMSKSYGNIIYPQDFDARGYTSEHLRFFLIHGRYRKKLNFTWKKLAEAKTELDNVRRAIVQLSKSKVSASTPRAHVLSHSILVTFGKQMDSNLDVKLAFDSLRKTVFTLRDLGRKGKLSLDDANAAVTDLQRVDCVLQVLF